MRAIAAVVALLTISVPGTLVAQEMPSIRHRVQAGDSLALLAAEYYGDRRHAVFILVANGLTHPRALKPGESLKIPMNRRITAKAGDTLESLAKQHMGEPRRSRFLAEFNNLPAKASVAVGQEVVIPFHVAHVAAGREKVSNIAASYFGDRSKTKMLQQYNFRKSGTLEKGESIIVPINHVRVQSSKLPPPDPDSTARIAKRNELQKKALDLLPKVRAWWRAGEYDAVKRELYPIATEYLDIELAVEVGVLLGAAYVAFDDDSALAAFRKVVERRPKHKLPGYLYSPKVRKVWKLAGGTVEL